MLQNPSDNTHDFDVVVVGCGVAGLSAAVAAAEAGATIPGLVIQSVKGDYDEVKERVVMAIESHGLVIDNTAHVGTMLERTGKDIGRERRIYLKAEVL